MTPGEKSVRATGLQQAMSHLMRNFSEKTPGEHSVVFIVPRRFEEDAVTNAQGQKHSCRGPHREPLFRQSRSESVFIKVGNTKYSVL
jgi:hypothetical protein